MHVLNFNWYASFSHFCPCYKKQLNILLTFLPTSTVLAALFSVAVAPATSLPGNQTCDADVIIIYSHLPIQTMPNLTDDFAWHL